MMVYVVAYCFHANFINYKNLKIFVLYKVSFG
jgi:hypothetical protein